MSANDVVWIMRYTESWHVFYSGCFDNTPTRPDYEDKWHKAFSFKEQALIYAHNVASEIGVEYGVCQVPQVFTDYRGGKYYKDVKEALSNMNVQINHLNKESIETNIIIKKTLDSWLEKNGERIVKEFVREFNPSEYMKMKFRENEQRIKKIEDKFLTKHDYYNMDTICDQLHDHEEYIRNHEVQHPKPRDDGCFQFTYCSECLAFPMGIDCPNLVKGPVQLKDEPKSFSVRCAKCGSEELTHEPEKMLTQEQFIHEVKEHDKLLIDGFLEKLRFVCYNMENRNWDNIDKIIKEYEGTIK